MSEEKRVRRTPEQIAADLDVQIEKLKDSILELENKKAASAKMCIRDSGEYVISPDSELISFFLRRLP